MDQPKDSAPGAAGKPPTEAKPASTSEPSAQPGSKGPAARRSQRVMLVVPVEVAWRTGAGVRVLEDAQTEVVSQHGALLKIETPLPVAAQVEVIRPAIGRAAQARVVTVSQPSEDGMVRIAIELAIPSAEFWGIGFPEPREPKKTK